ALGRSELERVFDLVWAAIKIQAAIGLLGALVLACVAWHLAGWLNIPADLTADARLSFVFLALAVPLILLSGILRGVLEAGERFDLVTLVLAPSVAGNYVIPLVGLALGYSLFKVVVMLVGLRALLLAVQFWLCCGVFPLLRDRRRTGWREVPALLTFG